MSGYYLIDPQETLDYACDWTDFLGEVGSPGDDISQSSWSITPQEGSPPAPEIVSTSLTGALAAAFVTACRAGKIYLRL